MKGIILFEESGAMRRAFNALGHDFWSCDLKPARDGSNRHFQMDYREALEMDWDFMAVMHPPCVRLTNSGVRWLSEPPRKLNPENYSLHEVKAYVHMDREERLAFMWDSLEKGAKVFSDCINADIPRIAIENPIMHQHAKNLIVNYRPATQFVQPWHFGDPFFKATGFHLKNLPPLVPTNKLTPPKKGDPDYIAWSAIHMAPPSPARSQLRSTTFPGMARAAAEQWGIAA